MNDEPLVRLNLGAGDIDLPGWTPIDIADGKNIYPLEYADGSVDAIRASHVLEHVSHRKVEMVFQHWVSKLKPGGSIAIAVPDFSWIAKQYMEDAPVNVQGYIMGGQTDTNDFHGAIFDHDSLLDLMVKSGLERIRPWSSEIVDCASLPVSLNLMGYKPTTNDIQLNGVTAVLSAPRFGPTMHFANTAIAMNRLGIPWQIGQGAYWHQVLSEIIENQLDAGAEYILTLDYDTIFSPQDVVELYRLLKAEDATHAVMALQMKRSSESALFGLRNPDGSPKGFIASADMSRSLLPVSTGHFGLTMFKANALRSMPRPWMLPRPNADGRWSDGKVDADIAFWNQWRSCGFKVCMAPKVVVGHLQEVVTWPTSQLKPIHQSTSDYIAKGMPAEVAR